MFDNLQFAREGAIAFVTLNRPQSLNALNTALLEDLRRAVLQAGADDSIRTIVITGAGDKAFAAGADLRELAAMAPSALEEQARRGQKVFTLIEQLDKPVIAAINGVALGGGCELALACTVRVAAETAVFGQPEVNLGLIPGFGATQRLPRLIGRSRALDLLLTGREHMKLQGGLHGLSSDQIAKRGDALLERVGLGEAADRRVRTYSGGMKRRLDLALALIHSPRLLFLDEPTTGLDVQSRAALWDEVSGLAHRDGVTVFLTTQYLEEADALADRVGIIHRGQLVAEGTPAALKDQIGRPTLEAVPADSAEA
jgi:enoyl-CoA hydratase/carnithine racemase